MFPREACWLWRQRALAEPLEDTLWLPSQARTEAGPPSRCVCFTSWSTRPEEWGIPLFLSGTCPSCCRPCWTFCRIKVSEFGERGHPSCWPAQTRPWVPVGGALRSAAGEEILCSAVSSAPCAALAVLRGPVVTVHHAFSPPCVAASLCLSAFCMGSPSPCLRGVQ